MGRKLDSLRSRRRRIDAEADEVRNLLDLVEHDRLMLEETVQRTSDRDESVTEALARVGETLLAEQHKAEAREAENAEAERLLQRDIARDAAETRTALRRLDTTRGSPFSEAADAPRDALNDRLRELQKVSKSEVGDSRSRRTAETVVLAATGIAMAAGAMDATLSYADSHIPVPAVTAEWTDPQYGDIFTQDETAVRTEIAPGARLEITRDGDHFSGVLHIRPEEKESLELRRDEPQEREITAADVIGGIARGIGAEDELIVAAKVIAESRADDSSEPYQIQTAAAEWIDPHYEAVHTVDGEGRETARAQITPDARTEVTWDGDHFSGALHIRKPQTEKKPTE